MAKNIVGIDFGNDRMKIVHMKNGVFKKFAMADVPEGMISHDKINNPKEVARFIGDTLKKEGINAKDAAIIMAGENVYVKVIEMPQMSEQDLRINLPFEFRDYITSDTQNYVYDYAIINNDLDVHEVIINDDGEEITTTRKMMKLTAVAAPLEEVELYRDVLKEAGLRMVKLAPKQYALMGIIRSIQKDLKYNDEEYCVIDLGYDSIRMYMMRDDELIASRELDGLKELLYVLEQALEVTRKDAKAALINNTDNCQELPSCIEYYSNVTVGLMRALNFYHFSHPESRLKDVYIYGGGAEIKSLLEEINNNVELDIHLTNELPDSFNELKELSSYVSAVGIILD